MCQTVVQGKLVYARIAGSEMGGERGGILLRSTRHKRGSLEFKRLLLWLPIFWLTLPFGYHGTSAHVSRRREGKKEVHGRFCSGILFVLLTKRETRIVGARLSLPQMRDEHS
jgi:hypothetical protein